MHLTSNEKDRTVQKIVATEIGWPEWSVSHTYDRRLLLQHRASRDLLVMIYFYYILLMIVSRVWFIVRIWAAWSRGFHQFLHAECNHCTATRCFGLVSWLHPHGWTAYQARHLWGYLRHAGVWWRQIFGSEEIKRNEDVQLLAMCLKLSSGDGFSLQAVLFNVSKFNSSQTNMQSTLII